MTEMQRPGWRMAGTVVVGAVLVVAGLVAFGPVSGQPDVEGLTADELAQEIELLALLARANLEAGELQALGEAGAKVEQARQALVAVLSDPEYLTALRQVREALLAGQSPEAAEAMGDRIGPVLERRWQAQEAVHQAAAQAADGLLQTLSEAAIQGLTRDGRGEPAEWLVGVAREARHIPPAEFERWLQDVSRDIAMELARGNAEAATATTGQLDTFLRAAREMTDAEIEADNGALRTQAQQIAAAAAPAETPEERAERSRGRLIELLHNERLVAVIQAKPAGAP